MPSLAASDARTYTCVHSCEKMSLCVSYLPLEHERRRSQLVSRFAIVQQNAIASVWRVRSVNGIEAGGIGADFGPFERHKSVSILVRDPIETVRAELIELRLEPEETEVRGAVV